MILSELLMDGSILENSLRLAVLILSIRTLSGVGPEVESFHLLNLCEELVFESLSQLRYRYMIVLLRFIFLFRRSLL